MFIIFIYQLFSQNTITETDKQAILQYHNTARGQCGSEPLVWDNSLEQAAVQCLQEKQPRNLQHGICNYIPRLNEAGENLYSGGNGADAALGFIGEKCGISNFGALTQSFSGGMQAGHWTQVVWKDTKSMSCAQVVSGGPIYCHYLPAGNFVGQPAILKAPTNSDCSGSKLNSQAFTQEASAYSGGELATTVPQTTPPQTSNVGSQTSQPVASAALMRPDSNPVPSNADQGSTGTGNVNVDQYIPQTLPTGVRGIVQSRVDQEIAQRQ